jgi:mannose-6-phosphate isomerase-like protein (cupin superfamily)
VSFPTEIPAADPGVHRFRADAEQAGPAVFTAPGHVVGGGYGLFETSAVPGRWGAVPHYHTGFTEAFWVISGRLAVMSGREWRVWRVCASGDFAHVPVDGVHAFRAVGDETARFLILFVPGAPRERYFRGLAELMSRETPPSLEEIDEFALSCDQVNLRDWESGPIPEH